MNVEKYLNRIGIAETITSDLAGLKKLQKQHLLNIPFENFDVHTNTKVVLDQNKIYEKIITNKRGGFCYELNGLFYELLLLLGFEVKRISACVYQEGNYGKEYDHLTIIATIAGKEYLVDVGFGEFTFHPLLFELELELEDERGKFIFDKYEEDYFRINKMEEQKWKPKYIFKNVARAYSEFEAMCHYHQVNPASHFCKKKFITIPTLDGRITLSNQQLKITKGKSIIEKEITKEESERLMVEYFNFKASAS